jgi:hypothetical protein
MEETVKGGMPDYSQWQIQADESLVEYYKRLALLRKGGILGTSGLMDSPIGDDSKKVDPTKGASLGTVKVNTSSSGDGGSDTPSTTPATLESMVRGKSGAGFDPLRLFGLFGPIGAGMEALGNVARNSAIKDDLAELGYGEAEVDALMTNPDLLAMELYGNKDAGFTGTMNKDNLSDGKSVIGRLFGDIFGEEDRFANTPSSLNLAMARLDPRSNVTGAMNGMMTANIPNLGGMVTYTPGYVDPIKNQEYWAQVSAENVAAEKAAAEAAAQRAAEVSSGNTYGSNSWSDSNASWDNSGSSYSFSSSPSYSSTSLTDDSSSGYAG